MTVKANANINVSIVLLRVTGQLTGGFASAVLLAIIEASKKEILSLRHPPYRHAVHAVSRVAGDRKGEER